ncbi:MAG: hypothetical protein M3O61_14640 [Gemmatimonadota bacterium]|nr:hypothetical protein [Gemmatimonadota bacterium]
MKPGTSEAEALAFDRAVSDLDGPSYDVINPALKVIIAGGRRASETAKTAAASAIHRLMIDPSFHQRCLIGDDENYTERDCWQALGSLGLAARRAAPLLRQKIEKLWSEGRNDDPALSVLAAISPEDAVPLLRQAIEKRWSQGWGYVAYLVGVLGTISPKDALAYCSRSLTEKSSNDYDWPAVQSAFNLGKDAIPTLEEFCGIFSGRRGKACAAAVTALRNGENRFYLP